MLAQSIRASRQALARVARQQPTIARRTFITPSAVRSADLVQDLYLRELKNYKVPQVKADDAEAHVQKFSIPAPPQSPEEPDIANELKAYETQQPDVGTEAAAEDGQVLPTEEDWFVEEDESITTPGATH
ncbi:hypothetical protein E8E12_000956 [Didymella heteroderae]|uniref:Uncharacterized protein n=1 Tax=Didymella heteroderae TaxID=1769908 RepID=A0A9P4WMU2_9PLEO|nr:hypothetical protein E8E12_000956 [Didymella heteroderae]